MGAEGEVGRQAMSAVLSVVLIFREKVVSIIPDGNQPESRISVRSKKVSGSRETT